MSHTDVPDARGEEGELRVQSGEAAPVDGGSPSTVQVNGRSGNADGDFDFASPTDAVARIVLQAEELAQGVREVAAREAELQAAEIFSEAETKAREQILEPAATRAAAKSQEIMAKAEEEAEAILAGIRRLFSRTSSDGSEGDDGSVEPTESSPASDSVGAEGRSSVPPPTSAMQRDELEEVMVSAVAPTASSPASDGVGAEGRSSVPPPMSAMQRDQLKEVIARRMGAHYQN